MYPLEHHTNIFFNIASNKSLFSALYQGRKNGQRRGETHDNPLCWQTAKLSQHKLDFNLQ